MRAISHSLLVMSMVIGTGCAGDGDKTDATDTDTDTVETDTVKKETGDTDTDEPVETDTDPVVPLEGIYALQSIGINDASVGPNTDRAEPDAMIMFTAQATMPGPAGFYNGPGFGNTAIMGLTDLNGPLDDLTDITAEMHFETGDLGPHVRLVVDLTCDGKSYSVLEANHAVWSGTETDIDGYWASFSISPDEPYWTALVAVWYPGEGPGQGFDPLVIDGSFAFDKNAPPPVALSDVTAVYPDACLVKANSGDLSMPKLEPTEGVMFYLGGPNNTKKNEWHFRKITVGKQVWELP